MMIVLSLSYNDAAFYSVIEANTTITVGGDADADFHIDGMKRSISVCCNKQMVKIAFNGRKNTRDLYGKLDEFITVDIDAETPLIIYATKKIVNTTKVQLPQECIVVIGRNKETLESEHGKAVSISLPFVSSKHFMLTREKGRVLITDAGSKNGIYLNGKRVYRAELCEHDVLTIVTVRMTVADGILTIENVGETASLHNLEHPDKRRAAAKNHISERAVYFQKSPRLVRGVMQELIQLEKPPQIGGTPQINWLNVLLMPLFSVALMVMLVVILGMSPVMLFMSGTMSVVSTIIAILNFRKQKAQYSSKYVLVDGKYKEYLSEVSRKIEISKRQQLEILLDANPTVHECVCIATERDVRLWNRLSDDTDFLSVSLGKGVIKSAVSATYQQGHVVLEENLLEKEAKMLAEESSTIDDAPILLDLFEAPHVGIVGEHISCVKLLRNMIVGLSTTHAYDDTRIVILATEAEQETWAWARWLPHCMNDDQTVRYICTSVSSAEKVLAPIAETLSRRKAELDSRYSVPKTIQLPHYIFVVINEMLLPAALRKLILGKDPIGCSALFFAKRVSALPSECEQIIEAADGNGVMYKKQNYADTVQFEIEHSLVSDADLFARSLAPLRVEKEKGTTALPSSISFLQGYGVNTPEELNVGERWARAKTYKSLSVPIAALPNQETFCFDVHQKMHGVHGIVAGTTGSGKTEMVQTWLLSLAVNYSPEDINFVLIDFKGTGLMGPFVGLPHVAGTISNLDQNIDRNLLSIQNEIKHREELVAKYNNIGIKNVNDLNKAYAAEEVSERVPILLIVIDEYAEFKKNYPDFGKEIDSLTATGLALGVFVVLMTQKPAGVVSAKTEDNIRFRWCLRVANPSASREMLGNADAAKINVPGRAYIKVGGDGEVYEQVQSFWSGAPYIPDRANDETKSSVISTVRLDGKRTPCETVEKVVSEKSHGLEISAVVQYIIDYCKEQNISKAEKVWTECLPERVALSSLQIGFNGTVWPKCSRCNPVIGLVDDPANQRQYPLVLDLAEAGHTIIYGAPVTGKTTLLKSFVMSVAMTRKPSEASVYIMDFGGWNLNVLSAIPHVGGIANDVDADRQKKLVMLIERILDQRKVMFAKVGVGNINSYREATGQPLTDVFLVIDNFGAVLKNYPEFDAFFLTLTSSGANYGVYMVATANSPTAVSFKISQQIKNTIALQQVDKTSYTSLVGKPIGTLPAIVGRGYIKGTPPLEFHTALPADGSTDKEITERISKIAESMNRIWPGPRPEPIPEMPERIAYGSVKIDNTVVLGLSTDEVLPVCYDYSKQHYLMISGLSSSGKSNLLQVITRQLKGNIAGTVYCLDAAGDCGQTMRQLSDQYVCGAANIDTFIEDFRPEMQSRYAAKQNDPAATFVPVVIVIDEFTRFFKEVSNDTISRLLAIIKLGTGLGLYLLTAADAYELASYVNKGEQVSVSLAKAKQAIMLGGTMNDHGGILAKATFAEKSLEVKEFEGYMVNNGHNTRFKAMYCECEV